jgi:hypothetical protein
MTREDIVRLWDEANNWGIPIKSEFAKELERFAALFEAAERDRRAFELAECYRCGWDSGVKAERDACARLCETPIDEIQITDDISEVRYMDAQECAEAIRARGEK